MKGYLSRSATELDHSQFRMWSILTATIKNYSVPCKMQ
jgi:hypothetical protein